MSYYTIGEVSEIVGIKDHVIRFWEKEFDELSPYISKKGNRRRYTKADIELIRKIKELLYEEKFTIMGAKKQLGLELGYGEVGLMKKEKQEMDRELNKGNKEMNKEMNNEEEEKRFWGYEDRKRVIGELEEILRILK